MDIVVALKLPGERFEHLPGSGSAVDDGAPYCRTVGNAADADLYCIIALHAGRHCDYGEIAVPACDLLEGDAFRRLNREAHRGDQLIGLAGGGEHAALEL